MLTVQCKGSRAAFCISSIQVFLPLVRLKKEKEKKNRERERERETDENSRRG